MEAALQEAMRATAAAEPATRSPASAAAANNVVAGPSAAVTAPGGGGTSRVGSRRGGSAVEGSRLEELRREQVGGRSGRGRGCAAAWAKGAVHARPVRCARAARSHAPAPPLSVLQARLRAEYETMATRLKEMEARLRAGGTAGAELPLPLPLVGRPEAAADEAGQADASPNGASGLVARH
jgi:hypothetical protein